jgi:hypothetical protein
MGREGIFDNDKGMYAFFLPRRNCVATPGWRVEAGDHGAERLSTLLTEDVFHLFRVIGTTC